MYLQVLTQAAAAFQSDKFNELIKNFHRELLDFEVEVKEEDAEDIMKKLQELQQPADKPKEVSEDELPEDVRRLVEKLKKLQEAGASE